MSFHNVHVSYIVKKIVCKVFPQVLLVAKAEQPKVCSAFPPFPWQKVFKDLACKVLDPATLKVRFKLCHDVLPVEYKLYLLQLLSAQVSGFA